MSRRPEKWHLRYFDERIRAPVGAGFANSDALLMGRVLYDEWAAYWPEHADEPFGAIMNLIQECVVFSTLQAAERANSEMISGHVAQKLMAIEARDGGGHLHVRQLTTVRWLLRQALPHEPNLLVHPIRSLLRSGS